MNWEFNKIIFKKNKNKNRTHRNFPNKFEMIGIESLSSFLWRWFLHYLLSYTAWMPNHVDQSTVKKANFF